MPTYEYVCPAGHKYEARRPRDAEADVCACGEQASRLSVYRVGFSGFASTPVGQSDFREDYRRFNEAGDELAYKKGRYEDSAQVQASEPRLYSKAKAEAKKLERAGVNADQIQT